MKPLLPMILAFLMLNQAMALTLQETLPDPAMEARAQSMFAAIRCVTCQSQSVAESQSAMAHGMRQFIRQEMVKGSSDEDIYSLLRSRYGDAVLMSPPVNARTIPLWLMPLLVLLGGIIAAMLMFKRMRSKESH